MQKLVIRPAKSLLLWLLFIHCGAVLCIWVCSIGGVLQSILSLVVIINLIVSCYDNLPLNPRWIKELWYDEGVWLLVQKNGHKEVAILRNSSILSNLGCILDFQLMEQPQRHLVIAYDAMQKNDYRYLKLQARFNNQ